MQKIKGLIIEGFQGIDKLTLTFDEKFNVLIGTSNVGKSSILRAIRWVFTNKPSGNKFINRDKKYAKVTLTFSDGTTITRLRGKKASDNYYLLETENGAKEEYSNFGSGVPKEIELLLGKEETFSFSFANQLEAPYLISQKPAERARTIGGFEEFKKLELAASETKDEIRLTKKELKAKEAELAVKRQEELVLTAQIDPLRNELLTLKKLCSELEELSNKQNVLSSVIERSIEIDMRINEYKKDIVLYERLAPLDVDEKVNASEQLDYIVNRIQELQKESLNFRAMSFSELDDLDKQIKSIVDHIEAYNSVDIIIGKLLSISKESGEVYELPDGIDRIQVEKIEAEIEAFRKMEEIRNQLIKKQDETSELKNRISSTNYEIENLLEEFVEEINGYGMCPTCLQSTETVSVDVIKNNL